MATPDATKPAQAKKDNKTTEYVAKQPTVYEIIQYDIQLLESQTSGRDFKLGAKIVRHLKLLKRKMNVNHVSEVQRVHFDNPEIMAKFKSHPLYDANFPDTHTNPINLSCKFWILNM